MGKSGGEGMVEWEEGARAALRSADAGRLRELLAEERGREAARGEWGRRAVLEEAGREWGAGECLRELLKAGADPDAKSERGSPALHFAAQAGNLRSARALLEGGADPNGADGEGRTAGHWAASGESAELARELLRFGLDPARADARGESMGHWAATAGSLAVLEEMIQAGWRGLERNPRGETAAEVFSGRYGAEDRARLWALLERAALSEGAPAEAEAPSRPRAGI